MHTCKLKKAKSTKALPDISAQLPTNYVQTTWLELNQKYSKSFIQKVAKGKRFNNEILMALISLAEKHGQQLKNIQDKINQLNQQ